MTAAELGQAPVASIRFSRLYLPEKSKHTQILEGSPKEAAAKLVEKLKFEVRVL
jgi:electron transfer flavoprotein beta subunit